jgi:SAM-dependent methyltransferase
MSRAPEYPSVLERIKQGDKILDMGCCFGQDVRKLIYDGAPVENVFGAELRRDFLELSYDLFHDQTSVEKQLLTGDIFDISSSSELSNLAGKMDIVYASAFIHLFDWEGQVNCCIGLTKLLKPEKGALLFGSQAGRDDAGEFKNTRGDLESNQTRYRHNPESFKRMWDVVGERTSSKWYVTAGLQLREGRTESESGSTGRIHFRVERL